MSESGDDGDSFNTNNIESFLVKHLEQQIIEDDETSPKDTNLQYCDSLNTNNIESFLVKHLEQQRKEDEETLTKDATLQVISGHLGESLTSGGDSGSYDEVSNVANDSRANGINTTKQDESQNPLKEVEQGPNSGLASPFPDLTRQQAQVQPGAVRVPGINGCTEDEIFASINSAGNDSTKVETLIQAAIVEEDNFPEATAISSNVLRRRRRRLIGSFLILSLFVIAISVSLGVLFSTKETLPPTLQPTRFPTQEPSQSPSASPSTTIRAYLENISPYSIQAFDDPTSPQTTSLQFLENDHADLFQTDLSSPDMRRRIAQQFALATLFYATGGEQWTQSNGWLTVSDECKWISSFAQAVGVCRSNIIRRLHLPFHRLKGSLPPEIALLSDLITLDLSENALSGTLPTELGLFTGIEFIDLHGNNLSGIIPSELGLLTSLSALHISSNNLEGAIATEIGLMRKLTELSIDGNNLSGVIPSELSSLSSLVALQLSNNRLHGTLPSSMGQLTFLEVLELGRNSLSGNLPTALTNLQRLDRVNFERNYLTGTIATGNYSFRSFDVSYNQLSGDIAPLILNSLPQIQVLSIAVNRLKGTLPTEIGICSNLRVLLLQSNRFSGTIPSEIGLLQSLKTLNVNDNNSIRGTIPSELGLLRSLVSMDFSLNELSGKIPSELGLLAQSLNTLNFNNNAFTALPSELGLLRKLVSLDATKNILSGSIHSDFGSMEQLEILSLGFNRLMGPIPTGLGLLAFLKELHLGFNDLTGEIPSELGNLQYLKKLLLTSAGEFSLEIPSDLSRLTNVRILGLAKNGLTSSLPSFVGTMSSLKHLDLSNNRFFGKIPCQWGAQLSNLIQIDLSSNNEINGSIPSEFGLLSSLGSADSFSGLIVDRTGLTGTVPMEVCRLRKQTGFFFLLDCTDHSFCGCCDDFC